MISFEDFENFISKAFTEGLCKGYDSCTKNDNMTFKEAWNTSDAKENLELVRKAEKEINSEWITRPRFLYE